MKTIKELNALLENKKCNSKWENAVKEYAIELLETIEENEGKDYEFYGSPADKKMLLNGASDWKEYSEGGCSLIYNNEIAERLCTPSELKKTKNGLNNPNASENWIDCQARALFQAYELITRLAE